MDEKRVAAGKKAAETTKARHGENFHRAVGKKGGDTGGRGEGFKAMSPERRREVALKGLRARWKKQNQETQENI